MVEVSAVLEVALVLVEADDLDLVGCVLDERAEREPEVLLRPVAEVYRVQVPLRLVRVYLLLLTRRLGCLRYESSMLAGLTVPR
jgi:hypothetical protein